MIHEEEDRAQYCDAMNMIHASETLLRKVKTMNQERKEKKFKLRKFAYVAAAALAVFVSSNAIVYAASGGTWVEKVLVKINGVETEVDAEHSIGTDAEGNPVDQYEIELEVEDESGSVMIELEGIPEGDQK